MNTQHLSEKMSTSGHHPMQKPVKTIIKLIGLFKQLSKKIYAKISSFCYLINSFDFGKLLAPF